MTNIAYQDICGGTIHIYSINKDLPKHKRIELAISELSSMGNVKIYLYKRRKLRLLKVKRY
jgi:hypothetical protein